jgi:undecaprenyl-diphosphatase
MRRTDDRWLRGGGARTAAGVGAGTLAACWLAGWAVSALPSSPGIALDAVAAGRLESVHAPLVLATAEFLAAIGGQPLSVLIGVALSVGLLLWRGLAVGLAFAVASTASALHVILMKSVIERPGPGVSLLHGLGSFPSGHSANAAVMAVFAGLLVRRPWAWAVGAGYVAVMAASRVVLAEHWLTDTIAGTASGAAVALLTYSVAGTLRLALLRRSDAVGASRDRRP